MLTFKHVFKPSADSLYYQTTLLLDGRRVATFSYHDSFLECPAQQKQWGTPEIARAAVQAECETGLEQLPVSYAPFYAPIQQRAILPSDDDVLSYLATVAQVLNFPDISEWAAHTGRDPDRHDTVLAYHEHIRIALAFVNI